MSTLIGRKAFLYYVLNLIGSGISFIGIFFMTRYFGANVYGVVSWTFALMATMNSISDLGFTSAHVKRISEGENLDNCVSTYAVIQLVLTGIMILSTTVSILVWVYFLGGVLTGTLFSFIALFILYYVLVDVANIVTDTYFATTQTAKFQLINLINTLIRVPLIVLIAIGQMQAIEIAYAYVIGSMGMLLFAWFLMHRDRIKWRRPTLFKSYYSFALPVSIIVVLTAISGNLDKIIIGVFDTSDEVGYYSSAQSFLYLFVLMGSAVSSLTFPSFSKLYAEGDLGTINKKMNQAGRYISIIIVPLTAIIFLFPSQIAGVLFGSDFIPAGDSMRFLALALLPSILNVIYMTQIYAMNRPGMSAGLTLLSFSISTILLFILVPASFLGISLFGLSGTGAAIANLASAIVVFIVNRIILKRLASSSFDSHITIHIAVACLTGIIVSIITIMVKIDGLIPLILISLLFVMIFSAILWVLKELTLGDVRFFLDVINPQEMRSYLSSEIGGNTPEIEAIADSLNQNGSK